MLIVALDLATQTGVAVGDPGRPPRAFSVDLGKSKSEDFRFSKALTLTHQLIQEHKPDLIVIEAPVGGPKTSHFLVGLVACVRGCCFNRGVALESHSIAAIRKHFLGGHVTSAHYKHLPERARKGAARKDGKDAVMNRCRALGWQVADDNAADAMALWDFAASHKNHAHAVMTAGGLGL